MRRFFEKYHEEGISYGLSTSDTYLQSLNNFYMQLTAKLIQLLPLQTGTGKNGQWKKQDIIVETEGTYPKKVCISIWGDKINESVLKLGSQLAISFDVESREYNGKWYTDVKAWKIEAAGAVKNAGVEAALLINPILKKDRWRVKKIYHFSLAATKLTNEYSSSFRVNW